MSEPDDLDLRPVDSRIRVIAGLSLLLLPVAPALVLTDGPVDVAVLVAVVQLSLSWVAGGAMFARGWRRRHIRWGSSVAAGLFLTFIGLAGVASTFFAFALTALGSAWGRPLRVRGRQLHPQLRVGADWTAGERPDASALDPATRAALEALWLHDAQKEHASVPAFSRVSWLLAAVGAPAELLLGAHQAAVEEIDHARRCFALAAGYGGRSHTVEPMPELLVGGMDLKGDPLVLLAVESLEDGCLLEDFNADVAARCEAVCEAPETREVLRRIAVEERSHAELSWDILAWSLARGGAPVRAAVSAAMARLERYPRPTAASALNTDKVAAADPAALRAHGRLRDEEWTECWASRVAQTRARASALLGEGAGTQAA